MGGGVAAQMAVDAPARVLSVALISPAGLGDGVNNAYTEGFVNAQSRRDLKPVVELLFADPGLVSRQMLDDLLKYKRLDGVSDALGALGGSLFAGGRQGEQPGAQARGNGQAGARRLGRAGPDHSRRARRECAGGRDRQGLRRRRPHEPDGEGERRNMRC